MSSVLASVRALQCVIAEFAEERVVVVARGDHSMTEDEGDSNTRYYLGSRATGESSRSSRAGGALRKNTNKNAQAKQQGDFLLNLIRGEELKTYGRSGSTSSTIITTTSLQYRR